MRLVNKTGYSTKAMRAFLEAGLRAHGASMERHIDVVYGRRWFTGRASCPGTWMILRVLRADKMDTKKFGLLFEHELAHNLGVKHEDMDPNVRQCRPEYGQAAPAWIEGLEIPLNVTAKTVVDPQARIDKRAAHARTMLERWERKAASAKRVVAKWARKVRYYERRAAAGVVAQPRRKPEPAPVPEGVIRVKMTGGSWGNLSEALTCGEGFGYRVEQGVEQVGCRDFHELCVFLHERDGAKTVDFPKEKAKLWADLMVEWCIHYYDYGEEAKYYRGEVGIVRRIATALGRRDDR